MDIFNRVNSGGTELSKGDLALAKLCAQWPNARQVMRDHLLRWKEAGYAFSLDWLLRNATAVATGRSIFTSLDTVSAHHFSDALDRSAQYVGNFLDAVSGRLGLDHDRVLMGRGAIPVVSRLLHLTGGRFTDARQRDRTLFWYVHAGLWGRFASSTETALAQDYEVLERAGIDGLVGSLERWRRSLDIRPHDFEGSTRGSRFYPLLYMLTRVKGARDVGSGLQLRAEMLGHLTSLQVHHIFPKALLYRAGFERTDVNAIANFCFLTQQTNLAVGTRRPEDYFAEAEAKHPGVLISQWIPDDPALWRVERYWDFLAARRELLADAAQSFLAELRDGAVLASTATDLRPVRVVVDDTDDVRATQVKALVEELVRLGCTEPGLDSEIADPSTGNQLAVAEAYWADGLQPGQGRPVVLELDPESADLPRMEELGYEVFTSVDALRGYVLRRNETAAGDGPTVDEPLPAEELAPVAANLVGPEFERAMHSIYDRARKEANYPARYFLGMLVDYGGLDTARRLLRAPAVSDGFAALWERGRLDLTVEALVADLHYTELFTEDELEVARHRLEQFGYAPTAGTEETGAGTRRHVTEARANSPLDQPNQALGENVKTAPNSLVLDDEHVMWSQHTGLDGHRVEPEWTASDFKQAQAFYAGVGGKAKVFLDLLIDNPGRVLSVDELCVLSRGVFTGSNSVAGAVSGLYRPHQSSGRRYPFYWWSGNPTRYAMKSSVAILFHQARSS